MNSGLTALGAWVAVFLMTQPIHAPQTSPLIAGPQ